MPGGSCACCYATDVVEIVRCLKCQYRTYCSEACRDVDWNEYGHKRYCGRAGELGLDLEIKESPEKGGLGVFALRSFARDEVVFAERPILKWPSEAAFARLSSASQAAVRALLPPKAALVAKFKLNAIACGDDGTRGGLFLHLSRVNHACLSNACHFFSEEHGVKVLVCARDIAVGEEITITYSYALDNDEDKIRRRRDLLKRDFGFECRCEVCSDSKLESKLLVRACFDSAIPRLCQRRSTIKRALKHGEKLISLYDELHLASKWYSRTYYDLFQAAVSTRSTLPRAKGYAAKAAEFSEKFYGSDWKDAERYRRYAENPALHPCHLILDGSESQMMGRMGQMGKMGQMIECLRTLQMLTGYSLSEQVEEE